MKDLDEQIGTWSADRSHAFKIRGETFNGTLGLDYEIVARYMSRLGSIDEAFHDALNALLLGFLGPDEFKRFDEWRDAARSEGNPLTIFEATLVGAAIVEEETGRPTRLSSGSSTGHETSGDGSTVVSSSPDTAAVQPASLSAVS